MDTQMPAKNGYEVARWLRQKGYSGLIMALTAPAMAIDSKRLFLTIQTSPTGAVPVWRIMATFDPQQTPTVCPSNREWLRYP